jgi:hypothetical protein
MTEMAVVAPLLIFMMLGVFEVGWALRGYLVLVNVNREITRFAIRPGYLNFSTQANIDTSYQRVRDWVDTSATQQLNLNFAETVSGTTTMIISHIVVDTGFPCADIGDPECNDCSAFEDATQDPPYNPFPYDDIIIHPGLSKYDYQAQRFGPAGTVTGPRDTRINYAAQVNKLIRSNNKFNCEVLKKGGVPSANNVIITEMFYDQPQLFGFPLISNPYTDPVPLYTHTTMRLIGAARSAGKVTGSITQGIDTIGPVCFAYPMVVSSAPGGTPLVHGQQVDILENGWLKWDFNDPLGDQEYLDYALQFPQMALSDFEGPTGDDVLKINGVVGKTGGGQPTLAIAQKLVNQTIMIPTSAAPESSSITVDGFVWVRIESSADIDLAAGHILARVDKLTALPEACAPSAPAP